MVDGVPLDAMMEQAIAAQRAGRGADAETLYRAVLGRKADHPIANHNLGVLAAQRGDVPASLPLFLAALQADPDEGLFWLSYARGLLFAGRAGEALKVLQGARQQGFAGPGFDQLASQALALGGAAAPEPTAGAAAAERLEARATALTEQGAFDEAISLYRQALALQPDFADAHFHLGSVLSENGQVAAGFAHYMQRAALVHGPGPGRRARPLDAEPPHKLKHDREQREYLAAAGLSGDDLVFHLEDGARLDGPAVNPVNATPALLEQWREALPRMVVIDDFLSPAALAKLRRYCAGSTVWRRVYDAGYIGATPEDGFACPLLAQIAEEIQSVYAGVLGPHRFRYLGAFKYDSELSTGTNVHADASAVNVNLYITPDDANLDPDSGGMRIWNLRASDETEMRRYNGDEEALRALLERSRAPVTVVPHRANRAVLFDSALYHRTDRCSFREGYLNKRINVSLLFGEFGAL